MYGTNIVVLFYVIKNITNSINTFIIFYQKNTFIMFIILSDALII